MLQQNRGIAMLSEYQAHRHQRGKPAEEEEEEDNALRFAMPGAGMAPDDIEPYVTVQHDGFSEIGCYKEYLYEFGDKFGSNKNQYEYEEMGNSSIVRYEDIVPKEDRELMTHEVCFRFCRTVPGMYNFGVVNGRDCYCAPFVKRIAGDNSDCDAVCEGDGGTLCGSKSKSLVFEMHWCGTSGEKLFEAGDLGQATARFIGSSEMDIQEAGADKLQIAATHLQEMFGKAGDVDADALMQKTKVFAGKISKAMTKATKTEDKLKELAFKVADFEDKKFQSSDTITAAEDLLADLTKQTEVTTEYLRKAHEYFMMTQRGKEEDDKRASRQYVSLMSFVDKEHNHDMSTCSGDFAPAPLFEATPDSCAAACDDNRDCVGFSYYDVDNIGSVCFLARKFKKVTYYTECYKEEDEESGGKFLQVRGGKKSSPIAVSSGRFDTLVSALGAKKALQAKPAATFSAKHNRTLRSLARPLEIGSQALTRALIDRQTSGGGMGCRCDEEKYLGMCLKKCSLLTEGAFTMRSAVNTCCRSKPCAKAGNSKTDGFGLCEGYGVSGDGKCGAPASEERAGTGECSGEVPDQAQPEDLVLEEPAADGVDPTAAQIVVERMKEDLLDGELGVGVDAGEKIEDDGPGLVMCFAKFSEFGGTKAKVKAHKAERCYK